MSKIPRNLSRLKRNISTLRALTKFKPRLRQSVVENADDDLIKALSEIALNVLNGNLQLSAGEKERLRKYQKELRKLTEPRRSIKSKRRILVQSGGAVFLPTLVATLLASGVGKLLEKYT